MSFDAVVVALALISASAIAIGLLMRKHSAYRESVADALARGDIAKEEVEARRRELAARASSDQFPDGDHQRHDAHARLRSRKRRGGVAERRHDGQRHPDAAF